MIDIIQKIVKKELSGYKEVVPNCQDVSKSVSMRPGVPSVTTAGL